MLDSVSGPVRLFAGVSAVELAAGAETLVSAADVAAAVAGTLGSAADVVAAVAGTLGSAAAVARAFAVGGCCQPPTEIFELVPTDCCSCGRNLSQTMHSRAEFGSKSERLASGAKNSRVGCVSRLWSAARASS